MEETPTEKSVLIPKIEPVNTDPKPVPDRIPQPVDPKPQKNPKWKKILVGAGILIIFLLLAIGVPAFLTYQKALVLVGSVKKLDDSVKSQDLGQIKTSLAATRKDLGSFKSSYTLLSWTRIIPFAGPYVSDLGHGVNAAQAGLDAGDIVLTTIEPYADLLGFKGGQVQAVATGDGAKTAQDRIDFVVKSLPDILPKIDQISAKMEIVQDETSQINADRYPEKYSGKVIRANIKSAQDIIDQAATLLVSGKPVIEAAPYLLGMDSPRTYLVLFQNDKELRPTGGFMTAYSIMKVDKAKIHPGLSQ